MLNRRIRTEEEQRALQEGLAAFAARLELDAATVRWLYSTWGNWNRWYIAFGIPKRREGFRMICAPHPLLKQVQRRMIVAFLKAVPLHGACHGFRCQHSIGTNAQQHIAKEVVLNLDLRDFFPSLSAKRVYGMWKELLDLSPLELRFLTRLTTLNDCLPQGAPTSPYIANIVCRHLDQRLAGLARSLGGDYTRYADDLTLSGDQRILQALPLIKAIIKEEGFAVAEEKSRIYRPWQRQAVNGLTVNRKVAVARTVRRRFRALLHQWQQGKETIWEGNRVGEEFIRGYLAYLQAIHPEYRHYGSVQGAELYE